MTDTTLHYLSPRGTRHMERYTDPMPLAVLRAINYIADNGNGRKIDSDEEIRTMSTNGWAAKDTLIGMIGAKNLGLMLVCKLLHPLAVTIKAQPQPLGFEHLEKVTSLKPMEGFVLTTLGRRVGLVTTEYGAFGYRDKSDELMIENVREVMEAAFSQLSFPEVPPVPTIIPKLGAPSKPLEVGERYRTYGGDIVTIICRHDGIRGYETVQGDDPPWEYDVRGGWRYNRAVDRGRCTASANDHPRNIIPVPIEG